MRAYIGESVLRNFVCIFAIDATRRATSVMWSVLQLKHLLIMEERFAKKQRDIRSINAELGRRPLIASQEEPDQTGECFAFTSGRQNSVRCPKLSVSIALNKRSM